MTTFDQELTGRYAGAGAERPSLDDQRVARAVFVRDTIRTIYHADKKFGIDPVDLGSLAELVDAAEEHLEHVSHDVIQRSVVATPTSRGETA